MSQNKQPLRIEQNIRKKVLWPLGIVLVVSVAIFLFATNYYIERELSQAQEEQLQTLTNAYHNYMQDRVNLIRSLLQQLGRDTALIEALDRGDRNSLLQQYSPLFEELLSEQNITHFYFHNPDGTNLLRLHKPERYGDQIDRLTMHLAYLNNTVNDGIELGPLGTFTLRVVKPIHIKDRLVGYIELGEDIDPILDRLAEEYDDKLVVLIRKQLLQREDWLEGRNMLGETMQWDLLPDHVVVGFTDLDVVKQLPQLVSPATLDSSKSVEVVLKGKVYRGQFLNMMDAAGRDTGSMLVLSNIDTVWQNHNIAFWLITLFCCLLALTLFMMTAVILGQVDRNLKIISERLAEENSDPEEPPTG